MWRVQSLSWAKSTTYMGRLVASGVIMPLKCVNTTLCKKCGSAYAN